MIIFNLFVNLIIILTIWWIIILIFFKGDTYAFFSIFNKDLRKKYDYLNSINIKLLDNHIIPYMKEFTDIVCYKVFKNEDKTKLYSLRVIKVDTKNCPCSSHKKIYKIEVYTEKDILIASWFIEDFEDFDEFHDWRVVRARKINILNLEELQKIKFE